MLLEWLLSSHSMQTHCIHHHSPPTLIWPSCSRGYRQKEWSHSRDSGKEGKARAPHSEQWYHPLSYLTPPSTLILSKIWPISIKLNFGYHRKSVSCFSFVFGDDRCFIFKHHIPCFGTTSCLQTFYNRKANVQVPVFCLTCSPQLYTHVCPWRCPKTHSLTLAHTFRSYSHSAI